MIQKKKSTVALSEQSLISHTHFLLSNSAGFTIIEVMISFAVIIVLALLTAGVVDQLQVTNRIQLSSSKDRIIAGVRSLAGSPAALRNSMIALSSDGTNPANPPLLSCAGGNPPNACVSGMQYSLTLYSPVVSVDAAGNILGLQMITAPNSPTALTNSNTLIHFNTWGSPCQVGDPSCPILVTTSFMPTCGPTLLTAAQAAAQITPLQLQPQPICTVADTIEVTYNVQVDPSMVNDNPELANFGSMVFGSVATQVLLISGNQAQ